MLIQSSWDQLRLQVSAIKQTIHTHTVYKQCICLQADNPNIDKPLIHVQTQLDLLKNRSFTYTETHILAVVKTITKLPNI